MTIDTEVVGKIGLLRIGQQRGVLGDMAIRVQVMGIKASYGKIRYVVKPIDGTGSATVAAEKISFAH